MKITIGIDEAGRGPLAGPLAVCALSTFSKVNIFEGVGIRDSKKLTEKKRAEVFLEIQREAKLGNLRYSVAFVAPSTIDGHGMAASLKMAVGTVLEKIAAGEEDQVLLDGALFAPPHFKNQKTIIKGDETELEIALASIVAKVLRDEKMLELAHQFPEYGFDKHKGYGTKNHRDAITRYGLSSAHRKSFCRNIILKY